MNYKTARMIRLYGEEYLHAIDYDSDSEADFDATLVKYQLGLIEAHIHTLRALQRKADLMADNFRSNDEYLIDTLKWMVKYDVAQEKDPSDNREYDESDGTKYED